MRRDNPDRNAKEIIANLEHEGWKVIRIARAKEKEAGVPDCLVARGGVRLTHLLEIKSPKGHPTEAQIQFARTWPGCVHWARTSWEADLLLKECEQRQKAQP